MVMPVKPVSSPFSKLLYARSWLCASRVAVAECRVGLRGETRYLFVVHID